MRRLQSFVVVVLTVAACSSSTLDQVVTGPQTSAPSSTSATTSTSQRRVGSNPITVAEAGCRAADLILSTHEDRPAQEIWITSVATAPCALGDLGLQANIARAPGPGVEVLQGSNPDPTTLLPLETVAVAFSSAGSGAPLNVRIESVARGESGDNATILIPPGELVWTATIIEGLEPRVGEQLVVPAALGRGEPVTSEATLSIDGLGPIKRGLTPQQLADATGTPVIVDFWEEGCGYASLGGTDVSLELSGPDLDDALVSGVVVHTSSFATPSGIRVGDSPERLFELFPDNLTAFPHEYFVGRYVKFEPDDPAEEGQNLWFEIEDADQSIIVSMSASTDFRGEGCA